MSWHKVRTKKPLPDHAVLVWEPEECNHFTAYWDGKRWWCWDPRDDGAHLLPFKPTQWCELPPHPSDKARKASGR